MPTHYVEFDVIEGATKRDAALLHGRILNACHQATANILAFDFPEWKSPSLPGTKLRLFAGAEGLNSVLAALDPLIAAGAVTHEQINNVPAGAATSDYCYTRIRTKTGNSASRKRRWEKRNPGKQWSAGALNSHDSSPSAYRIPLTSKSNGQPYGIFIARCNETRASEADNGLNVTFPVF